MPLWKQRMFARLMKPADDEGGDLGGGALAQAIDNIGVEPAEPAEPTEPSEPTEPEASAQPAEPTEPTAGPVNKLESLLDELTDDPNAKPAEAKPAEPEAKAPEAKPAQPKTPEAEEAELLEGVKSDRGKERIRQVFAEKKALEQDLQQFREMVTATGMSPQDFAQTLEFGRLVNSGDEKNLRVALEMIEGQRAMLYQKLGVEAPGVDLLKDHDDLKQAVDNMEITRERAVELAKYRKQQAEVQQRQQVQQQSTQRQQAFEQQVSQAATAMETYLQTRANEVDHPARMKVITEHFKNPANLQEFIQTYEPHQWAATIKMMYDNIVVPKVQAAGPQPIRSRPANLGNPAPSANNPIDRVAQRLENMGI